MKKVTVYTKPACVQCDMTKKMLDKNNIEYSTVDITEDISAFEMIKSMGFMSAPVVITDTDSWAGFQPDKITNIAA
jgi:glutaredoxin-like protein NrdH